MARRPRNDAPDTWHHVMNRGLARRTIFESARDCRKFLAAVAREVRAGTIEVHAFCLLSNHFHMLVRSPRGELSRAMRRLQNGYARWFNRGRRRDGPLFRGRFLSRRIYDLAYRRNVVTYIHDNAVAAGLASDPTQYKWSSAFHLARSRRPAWLSTDWVLEELKERGGEGTIAEQLAEAFPSRINKDFRSWVERQLHQRLPEELEDEPLTRIASPKVIAWMHRKAKLADGTRPFYPVATPATVERLVKRRKKGRKKKRRPLLKGCARRLGAAWVALRAGLLRLLAGLTYREVSLRADRHGSTCCRDVQAHLRLLETSPDYARVSAKLTSQILAATRAA